DHGSGASATLDGGSEAGNRRGEVCAGGRGECGRLSCPRFARDEYTQWSRHYRNRCATPPPGTPCRRLSTSISMKSSPSSHLMASDAIDVIRGPRLARGGPQAPPAHC